MHLPKVQKPQPIFKQPYVKQSLANETLRALRSKNKTRQASYFQMKTKRLKSLKQQIKSYLRSSMRIWSQMTSLITCECKSLSLSKCSGSAPTEPCKARKPSMRSCKTNDSLLSARISTLILPNASAKRQLLKAFKRSMILSRSERICKSRHSV